MGEAAGLRLSFIPVQALSWDDYKAAYPEGLVLSPATGGEFQRYYGLTQYERYDPPNKRPFLFEGIADSRLRAMERVVTLELGDRALAFPFSLLGQLEVINYGEGAEGLAIFWKAGMASALDVEEISDGKDVGATGVFRPVAEGRRLTFRTQGDGTFVDEETGSNWNLLGEAIAGPLVGTRLERVVHSDSFWFAWAALRPDVLVYESPE